MQLAQRAVHQPGEQRDPRHVGQDHVHREVAAHEDVDRGSLRGGREGESGEEERGEEAGRRSAREEESSHGGGS